MALRLMKVAKEDADPSVAAPTYWLLVGNIVHGDYIVITL